MNPKLVHIVLVSLIALAIVPFGMNALGARNAHPIDASVFRLFLATSLISWTTLVLFSIYLTVTRHALANFAWITVLGVFVSYFLINILLSAIH